MPSIPKPLGNGSTQMVDLHGAPETIGLSCEVRYPSSSDNAAAWAFRRLPHDRKHVLALRTSDPRHSPGRMSAQEFKIRTNHVSPSVSRVLYHAGVIDKQYPEDNAFIGMAPPLCRAPLKVLFDAMHERGFSWVGEVDGDLRYARQLMETLCRDGAFDEMIKQEVITGLQKMGYGIDAAVPLNP